MSNPLRKLPKRCFESQHMSPADFGLLTVLLRITHGGKRTLFFNGHSVATWFSGVGANKSSIYRSVERLERDGWLVPLNGSGKKRAASNQRYERTEYHVLNHDQWTAQHGTDTCGDEPVPSTGMEDAKASPKGGNGASPKIEASQSQNQQEPVPPLGHSFVIDSSVKEISVKTSSVRAGAGFLENQGQPESGVATLSGASIPTLGNGVHTVQNSEQPSIDWDAIEAKHGKGLEGLPQ